MAVLAITSKTDNTVGIGPIFRNLGGVVSIFLVSTLCFTSKITLVGVLWRSVGPSSQTIRKEEKKERKEFAPGVAGALIGKTPPAQKDLLLNVIGGKQA